MMRKITYFVLVLTALCIAFFAYTYNKKNISGVGDITIKYIDTKAKLLAVSHGHYLSKGYYSSSSGAKLFYDGKIVMDTGPLGKNAQIDNQSLSENGLHYSFVVTHNPDPSSATSTIHDLYVDGKKVESIMYPSVDYPFGSTFDKIFITNDGKDYFYLRDNQNIASLPQNNTIDLIRNGNSIFNFTKASSINRLLVSQDGLNTLLVYGTGKEISDPGMFVDGSVFFTVRYNNKEIYKTQSKNEAMPYAALSPNGKHYALIIDGKLFVDGKPRIPNVSITYDRLRKLQITDSGHYLLLYNNDSKLVAYVDDIEYVDPNEYDHIYDFYINDDASHQLAFVRIKEDSSTNVWLLDGKPITFKGDAFLPLNRYSNSYRAENSIEMQSNTIYIYKPDPDFDYEQNLYPHK